MYDPYLEELIDAALTDGTVTAKERQILCRKAVSMGIDLDEFEMVLDARIVKMQRELAKDAVPSVEKPTTKYGEIRKCPNCGFHVGGVEVRCPECGYVFTNVKSVSSAVRFAEAIQKAVDEKNERASSSPFGFLKDELFGTDKVSVVIDTFPIPNAKEDLFEFIAALEPKANVGFFSSDDDEYTDAYKKKYKECLNKVRALFPDDDLFAPFLGKKRR